MSRLITTWATDFVYCEGGRYWRYDVDIDLASQIEREEASQLIDGRIEELEAQAPALALIFRKKFYGDFKPIAATLPKWLPSYVSYGRYNRAVKAEISAVLREGRWQILPFKTYNDIPPMNADHFYDGHMGLEGVCIFDITPHRTYYHLYVDFGGCIYGRTGYGGVGAQADSLGAGARELRRELAERLQGRSSPDYEKIEEAVWLLTSLVKD